MFQEWVKRIESSEAGGIDGFTKGYEKMGFTMDETSKIIKYREWAPNPEIVAAYLIGDFNGWNRTMHPMKRDDYGVWSIELAPVKGDFAITHGSRVKISLARAGGGDRLERVPAWITRSEQDQSKSIAYEGVFWNPPEKYHFKHTWPMPKPDRLRIYEAHGM